MPLSPPRRYLTLASPAAAEIEAKRSRFVCDLSPAASEDEARAFVEQVRSGSRDARHHCTAFVLGPDGATQRSNDDGEPSGTAGAPMLDVLRGRGLTDVVAVVTRWFGGTLLGTGGLIRAYGDAVAAAVDEATILTMELREGLTVSVAAADGPRVENALRGHDGCVVTDTEWSATGLLLRVSVVPGHQDAVAGVVAALTSGAATVAPGAPTWTECAV
ncbi:YigZ family protein [Terrabacter carboxydivorans]|uniref:YigZ family protein n=1 Tax=Terrabacter carboxydivorans TaxID=619730 RepID=A0ABP5Y4F7_9MICO